MYSKGHCHAIFDFRFYSWESFPRTPDNFNSAILNFSFFLRLWRIDFSSKLWMCTLLHFISCSPFLRLHFNFLFFSYFAHVFHLLIDTFLLSPLSIFAFLCLCPFFLYYFAAHHFPLLNFCLNFHETKALLYTIQTRLFFLSFAFGTVFIRFFALLISTTRSYLTFSVKFFLIIQHFVTILQNFYEPTIFHSKCALYGTKI